MINKLARNEMRRVRQIRVRKRILGTPERPRMAVYKSLNHFYVQLIDDVEGKTLASASSLEADVKAKITDELSPTAIATLVGEKIAEKALKQGIESVVFDRSGYRYHGRIAAIADAARKKGLQF